MVLAWLLGTALVLGGFIALLSTLSSVALASLSSALGNAVLFGLILVFLLAGVLRKVAVYEAFVDGALDILLTLIRDAVLWAGWDVRFVDALPTALVKPFSGSAARAMLIETMNTQGVDSFPALLAATMQGSTETTFYVLAVYFGSVGIQRVRHAVGCALFADLAGVLASVGVCYWFFG